MDTARTIRMVVLAVGFAAALILTLRGLDSRFERADLRNAVEIVTGYRPRGGSETLPVLMARAHGARAQDVFCEGRITSTLRGTVRVTCAVGGRDVARSAAYLFDVDLGRVAIHPGDARTRRLLASPSPGGSPR